MLVPTGHVVAETSSDATDDAWDSSTPTTIRIAISFVPTCVSIALDVSRSPIRAGE
jgi:hypothetical protein